MDKKSGWGLIYKEYYMCKKYMKDTGITAIVMSILLILVLASFQYGNLSLLNIGDKEQMYEMALVFGKYTPIFLFVCICFINVEASMKEEDGKWRRFQMITPLNGFQFAFYKLAFCFCMMCIMLVITKVYCFIYDTVLGVDHTGEMGIVFTLLAGIVFFEVIFLFYGVLLGSYEKGGLAGFMTFFCILGILYAIFKDKIVKIFADVEWETQALTKIGEIGEKLLPYSVCVLLFGYVFGVISLGLVYNRREK